MNRTVLTCLGLCAMVPNIALAMNGIALRAAPVPTLFQRVVCTYEDRKECQHQGIACIDRCYDQNAGRREARACVKSTCGGVTDVCLTVRSCQGAGNVDEDDVLIKHATSGYLNQNDRAAYQKRLSEGKIKMQGYAVPGRSPSSDVVGK